MRTIVIIIWSIFLLASLMSLIYLLKRTKRKLGKIDLIIPFVFGFFSFGLGYLVLLGMNGDDHNLIWVFRSSFFLVGVLHVVLLMHRPWVLRNKLLLEQDSFVVELIFSFVGGFLGAIFMVAGAHYFLYAKANLYDMSTGFWDLPLYFILPLLLVKLVDFSGHIPLMKIGNPWVYPLEPVSPKDWPWRDLIEVNFELKRSLLEEHDMFSWIAKPWIEAPQEISIGSVFQLCMQERRGRTELVSIQDLGDEYSGAPRFCWIFLRKLIWYKPSTWNGKSRKLNPVLSLKLNNLEKGDIIIARRISGDGAKPLDANNEPMMDEDSNKTVIIKR